MVTGGKVVDWPDVVECWKRRNYQKDVAKHIPAATRWVLTKMNASWRSRSWLIGSGDLLNPFGSFKLDEVNASCPVGYDDSKACHWARVDKMRSALRNGESLPPLIAVKDIGREEVMFVDGNHRLIALHLEDKIENQLVYLGEHDLMRCCIWGRHVWPGFYFEPS